MAALEISPRSTACYQDVLDQDLTVVDELMRKTSLRQDCEHFDEHRTDGGVLAHLPTVSSPVAASRRAGCPVLGGTATWRMPISMNSRNSAFDNQRR